MSPRLLSFTRVGCILLALALFAQLLSTAAAFTNGQAASLVLGQPIFTSGARPITASGMDSPSGAAVDSAGRLWVADTRNHRVLRFDGAAGKPNGAPADGVLGQPNFASHATGSLFAPTASGMNAPSGVAVDSAGRLWVADAGNNRVLRFDGAAGKPNGAPADGVLGQPNFTSSFPDTTASRMDAPSGVAVDSAGRLWVADTSNYRVLRFDGAAGKANGAAANGVLGQRDFTSYAAATTASGMGFPTGVAVDSTDNLWVADEANNRVLRFDGPIIPTITWANPAAITYGTALSAAQLNASASVPGSFSYNPPLGTVLNVGAGQALSVTFTPTDSANYNPATKTVTIDVIIGVYVPLITR